MTSTGYFVLNQIDIEGEDRDLIQKNSSCLYKNDCTIKDKNDEMSDVDTTQFHGINRDASDISSINANNRDRYISEIREKLGKEILYEKEGGGNKDPDQMVFHLIEKENCGIETSQKNWNWIK